LVIKSHKNFQIAILIIVLLLTFFSCKVEEDKHPEVPFLSDVVDDTDYFKSLDFVTEDERLIILKNNHFFIRNFNTGTSKIVNVNGEVLHESRVNSFPSYFDVNGNYYSNDKKYLASNYNEAKSYILIDVRDSINNFTTIITKNGEITDSITSAKISDYSFDMYIKYDLLKEREAFLKSSIDTVKIKGDTVIYYSKTRKNDYKKRAISFKEFDESIIINKHSTGGHFGMPCIDYMNYYEIGNSKLKVKTKDHDIVWKLYSIHNEYYVSDGHKRLYKVLN
jgi:hypothetical protein